MLFRVTFDLLKVWHVKTGLCADLGCLHVYGKRSTNDCHDSCCSIYRKENKSNPNLYIQGKKIICRRF